MLVYLDMLSLTIIMIIISSENNNGIECKHTSGTTENKAM